MNSRCTGAATVVRRRHDDQRAVVDECRVERGENVVAEFGVAPEVAGDRLGLRGVRCREVGDNGAVRRDPRELGRVNAVDEDEPRRRFGEAEAGRVDTRARRAPAHRLERLPGERSEVGEPPLLVANRRNGQDADAVDRLGPQRVERGERARRQHRLAGEQAFEVARGRRGSGRRHADAAARDSSPIQS